MFLTIGAGCWVAVVLLSVRIEPNVGQYSEPHYPGCVAWVVVTFLWGVYFLNLGLEDDCKYIRECMKPWIKAQMWMVGVESYDEGGCSYDIDTDTSLCFYLTEGYKSYFNGIKRIALALFLILIFSVLTFVENDPGSWVQEYSRYNGEFYSSGSFLSTQFIVLLLLVSKIFQDLKAPSISVEYKVTALTHKLDPAPTWKSELIQLLSSSRVIVEKEACHFVRDFEEGPGKIPVMKEKDAQGNFIIKTKTNVQNV
jgi:hypothetical protein